MAIVNGVAPAIVTAVNAGQVKVNFPWLDEAHETVRRLRTLTTELVPSAAHWRNPEHRELFLSGLRVAIGEAQ